MTNPTSGIDSSSVANVGGGVEDFSTVAFEPAESITPVETSF